MYAKLFSDELPAELVLFNHALGQASLPSWGVSETLLPELTSAPVFYPAIQKLQDTVCLTIFDRQPQFVYRHDVWSLCHDVGIRNGTINRLIEDMFVIPEHSFVSGFGALRPAAELAFYRSALLARWNEINCELGLPQPFSTIAVLESLEKNLYMAQRQPIVICRFEYYFSTKELLIPYMVTRPDFFGQGLQKSLQQLIFRELQPHRITYLKLSAAGRKFVMSLQKDKIFKRRLLRNENGAVYQLGK